MNIKKQNKHTCIHVLYGQRQTSLNMFCKPHALCRLGLKQQPCISRRRDGPAMVTQGLNLGSSMSWRCSWPGRFPWPFAISVSWCCLAPRN